MDPITPYSYNISMNTQACGLSSESKSTLKGAQQAVSKTHYFSTKKKKTNLESTLSPFSPSILPTPKLSSGQWHPWSWDLGYQDYVWESNVSENVFPKNV